MPHKQKPTQGRYGREWHDGKTPDGFTVNGWRQITKGGYIRFCQGKRYHEKFKNWVGLWVFAEADDCWGVNVNVWPDEPWKDHRTVLHCTNESDWLAADPKVAGVASCKTRTVTSCMKG